MTEQKTYLCVGGPLAGKRYMASVGRDYFRIALAPSMREALIRVPSTILPADVQMVEYRRRGIHGEASFWVPVGQSERETIVLLLEAYERDVKRG